MRINQMMMWICYAFAAVSIAAFFYLWGSWELWLVLTAAVWIYIGQKFRIREAKQKIIDREEWELERIMDVSFENPDSDFFDKIPELLIKQKSKKGFSIKFGFVDVIDFVEKKRFLRVLTKKGVPLSARFGYRYGKRESTRRRSKRIILLGLILALVLTGGYTAYLIINK